MNDLLRKALVWPPPIPNRPFRSPRRARLAVKWSKQEKQMTLDALKSVENLLDRHRLNLVIEGCCSERGKF